MYELILSTKVTKFIDSLSYKEKIRVVKKLEKLSENPYSQDLDIKKLKGHKAIYRLRIGEYRLLFKIENEMLTIFIFEVGHRKNIYKKM